MSQNKPLGKKRTTEFSAKEGKAFRQVSVPIFDDNGEQIGTKKEHFRCNCKKGDETQRIVRYDHNEVPICPACGLSYERTESKPKPKTRGPENIGWSIFAKTLIADRIGGFGQKAARKTV